MKLKVHGYRWHNLFEVLLIAKFSFLIDIVAPALIHSQATRPISEKDAYKLQE